MGKRSAEARSPHLSGVALTTEIPDGMAQLADGLVPGLTPNTLRQFGIDVVDQLHRTKEHLHRHFSVVGGCRRKIVFHIQLVAGIQIEAPESIAGLEPAQKPQNICAPFGRYMNQVKHTKA